MTPAPLTTRPTTPGSAADRWHGTFSFRITTAQRSTPHRFAMRRLLVRGMELTHRLTGTRESTPRLGSPRSGRRGHRRQHGPHQPFQNHALPPEGDLHPRPRGARTSLVHAGVERVGLLQEVERDTETADADGVAGDARGALPEASPHREVDSRAPRQPMCKLHPARKQPSPCIDSGARSNASRSVDAESERTAPPATASDLGVVGLVVSRTGGEGSSHVSIRGSVGQRRKRPTKAPVPEHRSQGPRRRMDDLVDELPHASPCLQARPHAWTGRLAARRCTRQARGRRGSRSSRGSGCRGGRGGRAASPTARIAARSCSRSR